jgi:hypothetical protein
MSIISLSVFINLISFMLSSDIIKYLLYWDLYLLLLLLGSLPYYSSLLLILHSLYNINYSNILHLIIFCIYLSDTFFISSTGTNYFFELEFELFLYYYFYVLLVLLRLINSYKLLLCIKFFYYSYCFIYYPRP